MGPKTMALAALIALVAADASAQAIATHDRFSAPNLSGVYRTTPAADCFDDRACAHSIHTSAVMDL
jgi:hypothetical protein